MVAAHTGAGMTLPGGPRRHVRRGGRRSLLRAGAPLAVGPGGCSLFRFSSLLTPGTATLTALAASHLAPA